MKIETFVRVGNKIGWEIRRRHWEPSKLYLALISHLPTSSVLEKKVLRFVWIFLHSHPLMRVLSYSHPSHFSSASRMVRFHVTQKCLQLQRSVSSRGKKRRNNAKYFDFMLSLRFVFACCTVGSLSMPKCCAARLPFCAHDSSALHFGFGVCLQAKSFLSGFLFIYSTFCPRSLWVSVCFMRVGAASFSLRPNDKWLFYVDWLQSQWERSSSFFLYTCDKNVIIIVWNSTEVQTHTHTFY